MQRFELGNIAFLYLLAAASAAAAQSTLPNRVCSYSSLAVLGPVKGNALNPLAQLQGCGYAVADNAFLGLVNTAAAPVVVAQKDYAFAHEAPVYLPGLNQIFFVSNRLGNTSGVYQYIQLQTLDLVSNKVSILSSLTDTLPMANGATKWPNTNDTIALATQGKGDWQPAAIVKLNLKTLQSEMVLDSYFGRPFNSPNDVAFWRDGKTLLFTDPPYGVAQKFKPPPELGNYVYGFNTGTKIVRVASDGFVKPNGIACSPDYTTAYVTDTGMADGTDNSSNPAEPQTIYAFDVVPKPTPANGNPTSVYLTFQDRRTFAVAEAGVPDGIKVDEQGNVYTGTGTGVEVYAPSGQLLGTILIDGGVANLVFVNNMLYVLNEKRILAIKMKISGAALP